MKASSYFPIFKKGIFTQVRIIVYSDSRHFFRSLSMAMLLISLNPDLTLPTMCWLNLNLLLPSRSLSSYNISLRFLVLSSSVQGSLLVRLLFNVYISDLCCAFKQSNYLLFTDDIEYTQHEDCIRLQSDKPSKQGCCAVKYKYMKVNIVLYMEWLQTGYGFEIAFVERLKIVTTSTYYAVALLHTLQFITAWT
jgi:hypothetical protein